MTASRKSMFMRDLKRFDLTASVFLIFSFLFYSFLEFSSASKINFSEIHSVFWDKDLRFKNKDVIISNTDSILGPSITISNNPSEPFTELILSWNAIRPKKGKLSFWMCLKNGKWTEWGKIAEWSNNDQKSFTSLKNPFVHIKHTRAELQKNSIATDYKIKVIAEKGATIDLLKAIFVNTVNLAKFSKNKKIFALPSVSIPNVLAFSQWWVKHPRCKDFCSPTSMSIVSKYLESKLPSSIEPKGFSSEVSSFAQNSYDSSLDIYGNWLFNVAQAYNTSKEKYFFRVERLNDFAAIHTLLEKKIPVAVSIRGAINGGAWPYNNGHFVVIVGWSKKNKKITCIDPAFKNRKEIVRQYDSDSFIDAWGRSRNLSYVPILRL
jgi:hypothetical protein